jgi:hypothetical protein
MLAVGNEVGRRYDLSLTITVPESQTRRSALHTVRRRHPPQIPQAFPSSGVQSLPRFVF